MRNKPSLLRRTLTSIVLATALLFPSKSNADEPKADLFEQQIQAEMQILSYPEILRKEFEKTLYERSNSVNNIKEIDLIKRSQDLSRTDYPYSQIDANDAKKAGTFIGAGAVESLKVSTDKIDWIRAIKKRVSKYTDYQLHFEGVKPAEKPTEAQEQEEESTRINPFPGTKFPFETSTGIKTSLDNQFEPTGELYTNFNNPSILGYDFRKARITINNRGEFGFGLQRQLEYNWLGEFETKTDSIGLKTNVSVVKELKAPNSKLRISVGEERQKGTFVEFDYRIMF